MRSPSSLLEALRPALHALQTLGQAALPAVQGLRPEQVLRALYREELQRAAWFPLAILPDARAESIAVAAGGWALVPAVDEAARQAAAALRVALWWPAPGPGIAIPPEEVARLVHLDAFHLEATDPALAAARRGLLASARAAAAVHLVGEAGTGKRSLALWAHATLDDRPISWLIGNRGALAPGQWALFEEVEQLGPEQRTALAEALRARSPRPPPPPPAPARPRPRHPALAPLIGDSGALSRALHEAVTLAPTALSVLILGEPGVGKEVFARALHALSARPGPFVALDLGALPEALAESELFGHRKGAFTGADRARAGAFRAAEGGTLFLDELGNLPLAVQVKLLRALQQRQVLPLGEDRPVPVNVRVIAATNADLESMVARGTFRADLLGRLDEARLQLPPLRDRLEDLPALAEHLFAEARQAPPGAPWITGEALAILRQHDWPGNVRELGHVLRYAAAVAPPGAPVAPEHLGPLSPENRRPVPILTTSSAPEEEASAELSRALRPFASRVPPLRERGPRALQGAILHLLAGRAITEGGLAALTRRPWWGNTAELRSSLAALAAAAPARIDAAAVAEHLPALDAAAAAPIVALLSPALEEGGAVTGLRRDFAAPALVVGRLRSREQLRRLAGAGEARASAWLAALDRVCPAGEPGALDLGMVRRISRVQALIHRDAEGLMATGVAETAAMALAGPLEPGAPLQRLSPGHPVPLGGGGELRLVSPAGELLIQLFLFAGEVALAERGPEAAARAEEQAAAQRTMDLRTLDQRAGERRGAEAEIPAPTPGEAEGAGVHVWVLDAGERAALNHLLASFEGGSLKLHVSGAVQTWSALPSLSRLADFLNRAPRLSQYLGRLYALEENAALRDGLNEALAARPDGAARRARLPKGIGEALQGQGEGAGRSG